MCKKRCSLNFFSMRVSFHYICAVNLKYLYKYMKIFHRFASVVAIAVAAMSCHTDEVESPANYSPANDNEVCIAMPMAVTRTSIDPDGRTTRWSEGDELSVWAMNAEGGFTFSNATFMLRYFSTEWDKAYFVGNVDKMAEGDYTYYMCSPRPTSVDGVKATFSLSAQQSGLYDGKYDIMVAEPTSYGSITTGERVELNTIMRHQMHAIKITVPDKASNFDNKVYALDITFPVAVVGDVTVDVTNPNAELVYSNTSNTISVNSSEGFAVGSDIWVFVLPGTVTGDVSYKIKGAEQRSEVATYSVEREFMRGHVTPIRMAMPPFEKYTAFNFSIGENYLGEDFNFFTLYDNNGTNMGTFNRNAENLYTFEYSGEFDVTPYINKDWTLVFDSENAVVENSVNMGNLRAYFVNTITPVDVPYLLFEDFENVTEKESYGNNDYSQSEREQPGASLDGAMPTNGWNAARFWLKPGAMRINSRYQSVKIFVSFASTHHGRMDTPVLGGARGIKPGKKVDIKVVFDAAMYKHKSSSLTLNVGSINIATHTNAASKIDGIPTGATGISSSYDTTLADFGNTLFTQDLADSVGDNAFGQSFPTYTTTMSVTSDTRLCFYPTLTTASGTGNTEVNVYIDNLKLQITK